MAKMTTNNTTKVKAKPKPKNLTLTVEGTDLQVFIPRDDVLAVVEEMVCDAFDSPLYDALEERVKAAAKKLANEITDEEIMKLAKKRLSEVLG